MGNCFNCFKEQANTQNSSYQKENNEMTDIVLPRQISSISAADIPQQVPLIHSNEKNMNCYKNSHNNVETAVANFEETYLADVSNCQTPLEKVSKTFYQKLPTISRTISSSEPRISESKLVFLFEQYKDPTDDAILSEGIERLCEDLQLNPDDFKVLVLAWKLDASQMCRFTKVEFIQGLKNMKTDSIKGIQSKLDEISLELISDLELYKDLYRFTFKFGLDVSSGQRILPSDIAIVLWRLVFTNNEPHMLNRWLTYLENNPHIRGIPKDTWYMFLNFCEFVGEDLSCYDDTEAWPSLFDDFVEYENDQMNQNVSKNYINLQN